MTRVLGYACVHVERPERYFALRERRGRYFSLREKGNAFAEQSCVRRMHCLNKLCIQSTIDLFLLNQMRKSCPISPHVLSFSELIYQPGILFFFSSHSFKAHIIPLYLVFGVFMDHWSKTEFSLVLQSLVGPPTSQKRAHKAKKKKSW